MTETLLAKMYLAAKKLSDLNAEGKVKAFSSNEKGYARIVVIKRGCAVWMHHTKNDRLTISLMITKAMAAKFPVTEHAAIKNFEAFAGDRMQTEEFEHSINCYDKRLKRYIDVTNCTFTEISSMIDKVQEIFSNTH